MDHVLNDFVASTGFSPEEAPQIEALATTIIPHAEEISREVYATLAVHSATNSVFEKLSLSEEDFVSEFQKWLNRGLRNAASQEYWQQRSVAVMHAVEKELNETEVFAAATALSHVMHRILIEREPTKAQLLQKIQHLDRWVSLETAVILSGIRTRAESKTRGNERLATIGQLAASMGHDLRNPLGVIQSSLFLLRRRAGDDPNTTKHLDRMDGQVNLCNRIISDLLEMTRDRPLRLERRAIRQVFQQACEAIQFPDEVTLHVDAPDNVNAEVEPGLIVQCMMNLVQNSVYALSDTEVPKIWLRAARQPNGIFISVRDNGHGFPKDLLSSVFEPLVTSRPKGTGLGLALVRSVVARHGGEAIASNPPEGGALVSFTLPTKLSEDS